MVHAIRFLFIILTLVALPASTAFGQGDEDAPAAEPAKMNNQRLGKLLEKRFEAVEGRPGFWMIPIADKIARPEAGPAPDDDEAAPDERDPFDDRDEADPKPDAEAEPEIVKLLVITDENANRMRIMVPIREFDPKEADERQLAVLLLHANFDRALDAKYALSGGVLWSCFVHPLETLTEEDLDSALKQVRTLRQNTGTSYSSTEMIFGGGAGGEEDPREAPPQRPET